MPRIYADNFLNVQPFLFIFTAYTCTHIAGKIYKYAAVFFPLLHLFFAIISGEIIYVSRTIKAGNELLDRFIDELKSNEIEQSAKTLKEILRLREENPFSCIAYNLKELYAAGVIYFCQHLPEDREKAKAWYLEIDPTIYRVHPFYSNPLKDRWQFGKSVQTFFTEWNTVFASLIEAGIELGIEKDWLKEMPSLFHCTAKYFNALLKSNDPSYNTILAEKFDAIWHQDYYWYLRRINRTLDTQKYLNERCNSYISSRKLFFEAITKKDDDLTFECLLLEIRNLQ